MDEGIHLFFCLFSNYLFYFLFYFFQFYRERGETTSGTQSRPLFQNKMRETLRTLSSSPSYHLHAQKKELKEHPLL